MRVRDVDFAAGRFGVITLSETKNGDRRKVPMTQSVRALLEISCAGKRGEDYVFTWQDGRQVRDFRTTWKAVCTEAGVLDLKVHDLRRTGIRNMIRRGVTEQVAMKISGHKTVSVFRRYNITSDEDLHNAAALIEAGRAQFTDAVQSEQRPREAIIN
jgi:integrase